MSDFPFEDPVQEAAQMGPGWMGSEDRTARRCIGDASAASKWISSGSRRIADAPYDLNAAAAPEMPQAPHDDQQGGEFIQGAQETPYEPNALIAEETSFEDRTPCEEPLQVATEEGQEQVRVPLQASDSRVGSPAGASSSGGPRQSTGGNAVGGPGAQSPDSRASHPTPFRLSSCNPLDDVPRDMEASA